MTLSPVLRPASFTELDGWARDDHGKAFEAFRRSAFHAREKPYNTGSLGIASSSFSEAFAEAVVAPLTGEAAKAFFERHFQPFNVVPNDAARGFVTGFYEPQVAASPVRTPEFSIPLLGMPEDLVKIDDANRPAGLDPYLAFGRRTPSGIVEYFDRAAIEAGAIEDRATAVAWLRDPVDAYFIHVQGAARLVMPDGTIKRVTYAAKSGQRFTGAGRVLIDLGELPPDAVTMQSIRAWLAENPGRVSEILHHNRSYIFFREAQVDDPELGPVAAAKVPLTPGRSLAVDRLLHSFATPFFIAAPTLDAFGGNGFRRLMIAQDTGSAIVGPARGDLFAGSGDLAGEIAGVVRHAADFYALVPRALAGHRP